MITVVLVDGQEHAGLFGDSDHLVDTVQGWGHRLLDDDMLARPQCRGNVADVQLAGCCYDEQLNGVVSDNLFNIRIGQAVEPVDCFLLAGGVGITYGGDIEVFTYLGQNVGVNAPAAPAQAADADSQRLTGRFCLRPTVCVGSILLC